MNKIPKHFLITASCILVLLLLIAFADSPTATETEKGIPAKSIPTTPLQAAITNTDYILGPGDVIKITDETMGSISDSIKILDDQRMYLPLVGMVDVNHQSISELTAALNLAYKKYYKYPNIYVQLLVQRPFKVYVMGAVKNPGVYVSGKSYNPDSPTQLSSVGDTNQSQVQSVLSLSEALLMAGGLNLNADLHHIVVKREYPTPQTYQVDLWKLVKDARVSEDISLQDQDVIEIAELPMDQLVQNKDLEDFERSNLSISSFKVDVLGSVKTPGSYSVKSNDYVVTAIAEAGGFTNTANDKKVVLIRNLPNGQVKTMPLDMTRQKIVANGAVATSKLLPGDIVYVPNSGVKSTLLYSTQLFSGLSPAILLLLFQK